jgi:FkbM family methyltransferase
MYIQKYKYGDLYFYSQNEAEKFFLKNNVYQEYINDMYKKYHRPNSIILDIGANIGIFTVSFAQLDNTCSIYSFEPIDTIYNYLEKNIEVNKLKNVKLFNYGISDKLEETEIKFTYNNWGGSSITQKFDNKEYEIKNINTITIDSLNLTNVSFIKVDVQDHELFVIKGAAETLKNNNVKIILELPNRNEYENKLYNDCINVMNSYGYIYRKQIASKDHIFSKNKL